MIMENSKCDHLKTVISKDIKEQYTESLPVFDDESEILFYYKTIEEKGIGFLEGIYHIFLIDRVTGEMEEIPASDIISDETAQSIRFSPVFIQYQPEEEQELNELVRKIPSPGDALDLENNIGNWYDAYTDYQAGRIDQETYEDWKFKYPAFAGFDEDGVAVIYDENQSIVPLDIPELDLSEEEREAMRKEYEESVEEDE